MLGFPPLVWPNNSLSTAFESGVGETERNSNTSNTLDDRWRYYVHTLAHEYERHGLREKSLPPPTKGWLWFRRRRAEDSFFPVFMYRTLLQCQKEAHNAILIDMLSKQYSTKKKNRTAVNPISSNYLLSPTAKSQATDGFLEEEEEKGGEGGEKRGKK